MKTLIEVTGKGYGIDVTINVTGDRAKFLADADKIHKSILDTFDRALRFEKSKQ
jgi:hypothetical protein